MGKSGIPPAEGRKLGKFGGSWETDGGASAPRPGAPHFMGLAPTFSPSSNNRFSLPFLCAKPLGVRFGEAVLFAQTPPSARFSFRALSLPVTFVTAWLQFVTAREKRPKKNDSPLDADISRPEQYPALKYPFLGRFPLGYIFDRAVTICNQKGKRNKRTTNS